MALGLGAVVAPLAVLSLVLAAVLAPIIVARPRWLVLALVFFIPFQAEVEVAFGARISPQSLGSAALALVLFLTLLSQRSDKALRVPYLSLWLAYLFIGTLAVAAGPLMKGASQGLWTLYRVVWSVPLIYLGIWVSLDRPQSIYRAIAWLTIGASLGALAAIIQTLSVGRLLSGLGTNYRYMGFLTLLPPETVATYSGPNLRDRLFLRGTNIFRGHGTFLSHNGFGVVLCVTVLLSWGLIRGAKGKARWFWLGMWVMQLGGLVVTFSRSAWAAVAVGLLLIILWGFRTMLRKPGALLGIVLIVFVVAIVAIAAALRFPNLLGHFSSIFSPTQVPEFQWRLWVWHFALAQIIRHPVIGLGTSIINNAEAQIPRAAEQFSSHNLWVDIAYQRGLIALGIFILFNGLFFRNALKLMWDKDNSPMVTSLALSLLAGGIAFFVSGMGSPSMMHNNLAMLFWFLLGALTSLSGSASRKSKRACHQ